MKIPPYIFDTSDDVLRTLFNAWDVCDPAVSTAWITRGEWKEQEITEIMELESDSHWYLYLVLCRFSWRL